MTDSIDPALRHARPSHVWVKRSLWFVAGYLLFVVGTLLMLWLGSKLNPKDMALNRFLASAQAPLVGLYYPGERQNDITVLVYDSAYLGARSSAWPISYGAHADAIYALASNDATRPKAIFLDVSFAQVRDDATIDELRKTLCEVHDEFHVPLFLAALPSDKDGALRIRPELQFAARQEGGDCFKLVDVAIEPDPVDNVSWSYPVSRHLTDKGWTSVPTDAAAAKTSLRSAAATIASDVGGVRFDDEAVPMALQWGVRTAPQSAEHRQFGYCRSGGAVEYFRLVPGILRDFLMDEMPFVARAVGMDPDNFNKPICPYHRSLSVTALSALDEQDLAPVLHDKYVLIGAQIPGYNDFATSPVQGLIPGIYLHAMALDNFLTYGDQYKRAVDWDVIPRPTLLWAGFWSTLAMFSLRIFWLVVRDTVQERVSHTDPSAPFQNPRLQGYAARLSRGRARLAATASAAWSRCRRALRLPDGDESDIQMPILILSGIKACSWTASFAGRFAHGMHKVLAWVLRMSAWFALALGFIVIAQYFFPIGMLPVADLTAMIIFAEGIGYYEKFEQVVFGKSAIEEIYPCRPQHT
ncbi:MAG: CHASE2 domain-containing protein [Rhodocyclaceae bacterium]